MQHPEVIVIGSGFAGLSVATHLARAGASVTILEKNDQAGGRARQFTHEGFVFDMGPSWYWMPDVFEQYFEGFGKHPSDYYDLVRLDPSYQVFFGPDDAVSLPATIHGLQALFEQYEPGSGQRLVEFLKQGSYKYTVGMSKLVYQPSRRLTEFLSLKLLYDVARLNVFQSMKDHVRQFFQHEKLLKLVEFPVLFLGATPEKTPALYSLMNYADMGLGTWYPMGGMHKIVEGMVRLAEEEGVQIRLNTPVERLVTHRGRITGVVTAQGVRTADVVVAGADYHHVEQDLLSARDRSYSPQYWNKRTMAPSSLLFYIGVNKRLKGLQHHNLFFDEDFGQHAHQIYEDPQWPSRPLFYASVPSVTDPSVAPAGCENLFLLVPVAPDLHDQPATRDYYYDVIMTRLEKLTGQDIRSHVVYCRSYAHQDFQADYHAFKGNAYGLANTLRQTALLKPSLKSRQVKNLYYTGQLTVPGPGVPPSLISGRVVAREVIQDFAPHLRAQAV